MRLRTLSWQALRKPDKRATERHIHALQHVDIARRPGSKMVVADQASQGSEGSNNTRQRLGWFRADQIAAAPPPTPGSAKC